MPAPSPEELKRLVERIAARIGRLLSIDSGRRLATGLDSGCLDLLLVSRRRRCSAANLFMKRQISQSELGLELAYMHVDVQSLSLEH